MRLLLLAASLSLTACAPMGSTLRAVDEIGCEVREYKQTDRMLEFRCDPTR